MAFRHNRLLNKPAVHTEVLSQGQRFFLSRQSTSPPASRPPLLAQYPSRVPDEHTIPLTHQTDLFRHCPYRSLMSARTW
jgi:hypothetical protein